jgi:hypothetical protein
MIKKIIDFFICWYLYLKIKFYLYPKLKRYEKENYIDSVRYRKWLIII